MNYVLMNMQPLWYLHKQLDQVTKVTKKYTKCQIKEYMAWHLPFQQFIQTIILPAEVPVSLYIDMRKSTTCLRIQVVLRQNQVGYDKWTTVNIAPSN